MGAGADLSGMFSAFDGTPSFTTLQNTKSQPLQTAINTQLGDYNTNVAANNQDLNSFITQWNANNPTATANTNQEVNAISGFYNGSVAQNLAAENQDEAEALQQAGNQALAYATQNRNLGQLTSGTGNSSYNTRLGIANANTINIQNAENLAQQRAGNYTYLLGQQVGLAGARNNLINANANRALVPANARDSLQSSELANLGTIQGLNNANNFYGLSQNQSFWDQLGNFSGDALDLAENIAGEVASDGMNSSAGNDPQLNASQAAEQGGEDWSTGSVPSYGNAGGGYGGGYTGLSTGVGGGVTASEPDFSGLGSNYSLDGYNSPNLSSGVGGAFGLGQEQEAFAGLGDSAGAGESF